MVVQRIEHKKDEPSLFGPTYTHRCILTNDHDSSKEDIVKFYNQRGASERNFDEILQFLQNGLKLQECGS